MGRWLELVRRVPALLPLVVQREELQQLVLESQAFVVLVLPVGRQEQVEQQEALQA